MQVDDEAAFLAGADTTPVPDADTPTPTPAEPEVAESETKAEQETEKPDAEAKPEGEGEGDKEKRTPWFQRRIDDLTREKHDQRRRADALEEQLARLSAQTPADGETPAGEASRAKEAPAADPVEIAKQIVARQQFDAACNAAYEQGTKEFGKEFDDALGSFRLLGGMPNELVEAALEAGDAHRILYTLGKDPDDAARILALPPIRMAAAVAKLAAKPVAAKPVSKVPDPPRPIGGRSGDVEQDPDKMPIDQWMKWHDDQQAKKRA